MDLLLNRHCRNGEEKTFLISDIIENVLGAHVNSIKQNIRQREVSPFKLSHIYPHYTIIFVLLFPENLPNGKKLFGMEKLLIIPNNDVFLYDFRLNVAFTSFLCAQWGHALCNEIFLERKMERSFLENA